MEMNDVGSHLAGSHIRLETTNRFDDLGRYGRDDFVLDSDRNKFANLKLTAICSQKIRLKELTQEAIAAAASQPSKKRLQSVKVLDEDEAVVSDSRRNLRDRVLKLDGADDPTLEHLLKKTNSKETLLEQLRLHALVLPSCELRPDNLIRLIDLCFDLRVQFTIGRIEVNSLRTPPKVLDFKDANLSTAEVC